MQILWKNIAVFLLGVFTLVMAVRYRYSILEFLESMFNLGPGHDPHDKTVGLVAFGLVLVGMLALVKILTHSGGR